MQRPPDLPEVERALVRVLGLRTVAPLNRVQLAPEPATSCIGKRREMGERLGEQHRVASEHLMSSCRTGVGASG